MSNAAPCRWHVKLAAYLILGLVALPAAAAASGQSAALPQKGSVAEKGAVSGSGPTAQFSGSLRDGTGRALPDVPMALVDSSGHKHETRTDEGGRFAFAGLAAGEYDVEASKPGFSEKAGHVTLAATQVRRDVVLQIAGIRHMYRVGLTSPEADPAAPPPTTPQKKVVRTTPPDDPCSGSKAAGCVTPPMRMVEAWPIFPPALAEKGTSGNVDVSGRLGGDGRLKDLRVGDGADPEFATAALEALGMWEYSPVRVNGIPQECPFAVTFRFIAEKK